MMTKHIPFTYRIIHNPSGKWYYGVKYSKGCSPDDLWKTYFTSSSTVKSLIEETGIESFTIEIRRIFDNPASARNWELKVLRKIINWPNCLNMNAFPAVSYDTARKAHMTKLNIDPITGLNGYQRAKIVWNNRKFSIDPVSGKTYAELSRLKTRETRVKNGTLSKPNPKLRGNGNPMKNPETCKKVSDKLKEGYSSGRLTNKFSGKIHSVETKELMILKKLGENNPCYGTMFINNGFVNKRIRKSLEIPTGWVKGRLITQEHKHNSLNSNIFMKEFLCDIQTKKHYNKGNASRAFPLLKQYF